MTEFSWVKNHEALAEVRTMWAEMKSARQIAIYISEKYSAPITRNSIIGLVNRLGIGRPNKTANYEARRAGKPPKPPRQRRSRFNGQYLRLVWSEPVHTGLSVTFQDLRAEQCRWIYGEPRGLDTAFCGAPTGKGQSYCAHHYVRCHRDFAEPATAGAA